MEFNEEIRFLNEIMEKEVLSIDNFGVAAIPNKDGNSGTVMLVLKHESGKEFICPIDAQLALAIGEQLMRAADTIEKNIFYNQN
ncbi:hypothetical protein BN1007_71133 [Klebsiella variicola]|uniref:hypothetical protein n=1 Tax=Klebsiella variicola TaxID=244366 RepID=UPI0006720DB3|nr:hypothetical protein [Klebsiella variicola]CTQ18711.1 hypothetical protein BN1007_71133 [Klebsiella variicola]CTQ25755.1 hypothetical protein BN1200_870014 [Klebsiella variicola]